MLQSESDDSVPANFGQPKLMYRANEQQGCANIPIADDTLVEGTEKFTIRVFTNKSYVTIDEDHAIADIYIMDSDCKPEHVYNAGIPCM